MANKQKSSVFELEKDLVSRCNDLDQDPMPQESRELFSELLGAYKKLLRQTEKITKVGDSIQRKLVKAREEILVKNRHLMEAQKELMHKEKMVAMNTLVQGLAHEICNPLNFINNFAHLNLELSTEIQRSLEGEDKGVSSEEIAEHLDDLHHGALIIREHGQRAASIVESMGRVIGVGRGQQGLRIPEDPVYLLENFTTPLIRDFSKTMDGRLQVEKKFCPRIPPLEVVVEDLGTVFTQLVSNALEALQARLLVEEFEPTLRLICESDDTYVFFHVDDNGDGIPEDNLEKVFTPFFTTREAASNLGLGLSTSYDIVVNGYSGDLKVDPDLDGFTRFSVILPLPR